MPFEEIRGLVRPDAGQQLWRYMDFSKFVSLLQTKSLYFSSLDQFQATDPWEGYPSKLNFSPEMIMQINAPETPVHGQLIDPYNAQPKSRLTTKEEFYGDKFLEQVEYEKQMYSSLRRTIFANCWHMNNGESDSQWRLYGSIPESVAIVTSIEKLEASLVDSRSINISRIIYFDPKHDAIPAGNIYYPAVHKRKAFSHERECRLLYWDSSLLHTNTRLKGINISFDISNFIEQVIISPRAPEWFVSVVANVIKDYGFNLQYSRSDLLDPFI